MDFFFCEACGKRLTEHDIDGGDAKNKKLKGVFCKECAVGVLTMETLPLTDQDAKQVLKQAGTGSVQRPAHRGTSVGMPNRKRRC